MRGRSELDSQTPRGKWFGTIFLKGITHASEIRSHSKVCELSQPEIGNSDEGQTTTRRRNL
jgi:hypothetical protein